jgi:predicted CxxxxCH...CXXCH cytochrome family protein
VLPTDATHETQPVSVVFGPLARTGNLNASWNQSTGTCGTVYCHGAQQTGGLRTSPSWDGGASDVQCDSCHGASPIANGHVATGVKYCSVCHPSATSAGTIDVAGGAHINGVVNTLAAASRSHPNGWKPPGHIASVDFTTCTVCHANGRTCSSCH